MRRPGHEKTLDLCCSGRLDAGAAAEVQGSTLAVTESGPAGEMPNRATMLPGPTAVFSPPARPPCHDGRLFPSVHDLRAVAPVHNGERVRWAPPLTSLTSCTGWRTGPCSCWRWMRPG